MSAWLGVDMRSIWGAALLLTACGGDDAKPGLEGLWLVEGDGGFDCALGVKFGPDDYYEADIICSLEGGGYGVQVSAGTYSDYGDSVRVWFTRSSCADLSQRVADIGYRLNGDTLSLGTPTGVAIFERVEGDGMGQTGIISFGCFAEDGTFTARAVQELP